MKLTNNSLGPKAISTTDRGVVVLAPGESADLNVSDADADALKAAKLLEPPEGGTVPSLADLQREVASTTLGTGARTEPEADADVDQNLPAADDPDVLALVDGNDSQELQKLAEDEKVDMTGARNKNDAARRIVAARRSVV